MDEKFSVSYNQPLQDIAGNILDVKITTSTYDPVADKLVRQIASKKTEECIEDEPVVFKCEYSIPASTHAVPMVAQINNISPDVFIRPPTLKRNGTIYDA
jgi:hypothetical protein